METNVTRVALSTPKDNSSVFSRNINAGEKYSTFSELLKKLSKLGKPAESVVTEKGRCLTTYRDENGVPIGGTDTPERRNAKTSRSVIIGNLTYTTEVESEKVNKIFDCKHGAVAKDNNKNGVIDSSEITNFGPPKLN